MRTVETSRGFRVIEAPDYPPTGETSRLVQESSAIGDYDDAAKNAGSSYLWFGEKHHLKIYHALGCWLITGRLPEPEPRTERDKDNEPENT